MLTDFRLDHAGLAEVLKSGPFVELVAGKASEIATAVSAQQPDAEVVTDSYTTDRAAASVTVKDPRAATWQARDGLLTRSAAAAGLEVTEKS